MQSNVCRYKLWNLKLNKEGGENIKWGKGGQ